MSKELLFSVTKKDLEIQTFAAGGSGGQNQNKRHTGVRIIHKESGAVGEARDSRHQEKNRRAAFARLIEHPKFRVWKAGMVQQVITGKTLEERVEEQMDPKNLKVEARDERGRWVTVEEA